MKQLPLTSALICAACSVAMAVVALGGFYFAGFSWPVFAAMGLTTALIFTAGWLLGWRLARFLRNLKTEFSQIAERDTDPDGLAAPPLEDFRKLSEAWREARERITRIFSSQKDFTVNAAHELKTPLAALRVTGETALRSTAHEEELRETIGAMLEETLRVSDVGRKTAHACPRGEWTAARRSRLSQGCRHGRRSRGPPPSPG